MRKFLILVVVFSTTFVVTKGWLVLDFPFTTTNDEIEGPVREPQQSRIRQKEDPILQMWGPDSAYSRVPGKRSTMSSWGADFPWRPDSMFSRIPGKRHLGPHNGPHIGPHIEPHMPMVHKRGLLDGWGRSVFLPWTINKSGSTVYDTRQWEPKTKKEANEGNEEVVNKEVVGKEVVDEEVLGKAGQGALKALLPWGMNLRSPMLRGKKAHFAS